MLGLTPAARGHEWIKQLARPSRLAAESYTAIGFLMWQRRRRYAGPLRSADQWHASFQQVFHADGPAGGENSAAAPASS
jgi:hypothetical protein